MKLLTQEEILNLANKNSFSSNEVRRLLFHIAVMENAFHDVVEDMMGIDKRKYNYDKPELYERYINPYIDKEHRNYKDVDWNEDIWSDGFLNKGKGR